VAFPYHGEPSWWKVKGADGLEGVESLRLLMKLQINQLQDNIYYIHDNYYYILVVTDLIGQDQVYLFLI
jgi:hypothetical protein